MGEAMRTEQVTQEFRDKAKELAKLSKMPEVKTRLDRLALQYERELGKLQAPWIVPKQSG
jgi:uncharacterized protein YceH (UPF0502 family)